MLVGWRGCDFAYPRRPRASNAGRRVLYLGVVSLVAGCSVTPKRDNPPEWEVHLSKEPERISRLEPLSPFGNPEFYEVNGKRYYPLKSSIGFVERGVASWYGIEFHGRPTSSGETYDMYQMTAAHRILPLPTYCEVTNLQNGHKVLVKVNDRGPFIDERIIDLSYAAAKKLGLAVPGTGLVEVRAIGPEYPQFAAQPRVTMPSVEPEPAMGHLKPSRVQAEPSAKERESDVVNAHLEPMSVAVIPTVQLSERKASQRPEAVSRYRGVHYSASAFKQPLSFSREAIGATGKSPAGQDALFYLQVGAFAEKINAERLRNRINGTIRQAVRIHPGLNLGKPIYKVQVGPFVSVEMANRIAQIMKRLGLRDHYLVVDNGCSSMQGKVFSVTC